MTKYSERKKDRTVTTPKKKVRVKVQATLDRNKNQWTRNYRSKRNTRITSMEG